MVYVKYFPAVNPNYKMAAKHETRLFQHPNTEIIQLFDKFMVDMIIQ